MVSKVCKNPSTFKINIKLLFNFKIARFFIKFLKIKFSFKITKHMSFFILMPELKKHRWCTRISWNIIQILKLWLLILTRMRLKSITINPFLFGLHHLIVLFINITAIIRCTNINTRLVKVSFRQRIKIFISAMLFFLYVHPDHLFVGQLVVDLYFFQICTF